MRVNCVSSSLLPAAAVHATGTHSSAPAPAPALLAAAGAPASATPTTTVPVGAGVGRGAAERLAAGASSSANVSLSALEASDVRQLFRLHERLRGCEVVAYRCDADELWYAVTGLYPIAFPEVRLCR